MTPKRLKSSIDLVRSEDQRLALQEDLAAFMRAAWPHLEPKTPLIWGWHIDCILEHLEAVARGEIRTLLTTIPPRHLKSTLISVIFPAWLWTRETNKKLLTGSYAMPLAMRDATRTRRIITSPWYMQTFPHVRLEEDQTAKQRYDLVGGGARYCFSTAGTITGEGADILLYDDPHKAQDMHSVAKLEAAIEFWTETLPTRLNDPMHSTVCVIMQRLGKGDLAGHILRESLEHRDSNLVHVNLPVHFDPARACKTRWFRDPRREKGELLWPERMNHRALREITRRMSAATIAAQLEQDPADKGGTILRRENWRIWGEPKLPRCEAYILSIDPSMKAKEEGDPWACTVWGCFQHYGDAPMYGKGAPMWNLILLGAWEAYCSYPEAKAKILRTISEWTIDDTPPDAVIVEDKAAGPVLITELQIAGIDNVTPWPRPESKYRFPDKVARAHLVSDLHENGKIWVPGRKLRDGTRSDVILQPFAEVVVAQAEVFPTPTEHDDLVDCCTQAWWFMRESGWASLDTDPEDSQGDEQRAPLVESAYGAY